MAQRSSTELVMERPAAEKHPAGSMAVPVRSILHVIHNDAGAEKRLQAALTLARACGAHLSCVHVTPIQAYSVTDTFGGTFVSGDIVRSLTEEAAELRSRTEAHLSREDVGWEYHQVTGEVGPQILAFGSLSDLIVTGREPRSRELGASAMTLLGDLLHSSRTPFLVISDDGRVIDPCGPAVIAWNGSFEAANAVRASLGLLAMASEVHVIRFAEDRDEQFPPTRLLEFLSRHGLHAELTTREQPKADLPNKIVEFAGDRGAAYMVIGAYSHTRAGEFFFGGVTRSLLKECKLPLVIAR